MTLQNTARADPLALIFCEKVTKNRKKCVLLPFLKIFKITTVKELTKIFDYGIIFRLCGAYRVEMRSYCKMEIASTGQAVETDNFH